ncbi:hypothetical protein LEP1GSC061_3197 [Leptospira wolffii serovar Khorat str. Khorat-H2]|nr:hypothetical protein LEP1GSC061_3197 [Leptospira wolffii serovar Khorat str. Khorat-H2]
MGPGNILPFSPLFFFFDHPLSVDDLFFGITSILADKPLPERNNFFPKLLISIRILFKILDQFPIFSTVLSLLSPFFIKQIAYKSSSKRVNTEKNPHP